jgi:hypothetical protein
MNSEQLQQSVVFDKRYDTISRALQSLSSVRSSRAVSLSFNVTLDYVFHEQNSLFHSHDYIDYSH